MAKYEDIAKAYGKTSRSRNVGCNRSLSKKVIRNANIESMIQGSKVETRSHKFSAAAFNAAEGSKTSRLVRYWRQEYLL